MPWSKYLDPELSWGWILGMNFGDEVWGWTIVGRIWYFHPRSGTKVPLALFFSYLQPWSMVILQSLELQGCIVSHLKFLILGKRILLKKEFESTFLVLFLHSKNPHSGPMDHVFNSVYLLRVPFLTVIAVLWIFFFSFEIFSDFLNKLNHQSLH